MSIPALRQPKLVSVPKEKPKPKIVVSETQYVIVNLKCGKKLVVTSDAYHGVLTAGDIYRCVFCPADMVLELSCKERHKESHEHRKILETYPHIEEYSNNLIRQVSDNYYCTICNVIVLSTFLTRHLITEVHNDELQKAMSRAEAYKPC